MLNIIDHGRVRELRMDRPPVNAMNTEMLECLTGALESAASQAEAIVISGRDGLFSAGLDVPELLGLDPAGMGRFWNSFFGVLETTARSPVPVAAAITGHAPAGGAVLALFCDTRVMTRGEFRIGLNETRVGLVVPVTIRDALVRLTGPHRAERMIVAGALIGPEEALDHGLVDALAESPAAAIAGAISWCRQHLELPREAMLGNRQLARAGLMDLFSQFRDKEVAAFVARWFDEPTQRALRAMVDQLKKKP